MNRFFSPNQVSTVDGFQGREVDVVLFSCVRAPSSPNAGFGGRGGIGFLADRRRMNVAITRAKRSLVVLGNARRLSSDTTWKALVDHAKSRERLVSDMAEGRGGGGGGRGDAESGEALCARLERRYKAAKSDLKGTSQGRTRNPGRRLGERSPDDDEVHDGSAVTCRAGGDGDAQERRPCKERTDRRGSTHQPGSDMETLGSSTSAGKAAAVEERRVHPRVKSSDRRQDDDGDNGPTRRREKQSRSAEATREPPPVEGESGGGRDRSRKNLDRRQDAGEDSGTGRRRKTPSSSAGKTRSPSVRGEGGARRDRRPAQQTQVAAAGVMGMAAGSSLASSKRRDDVEDIPRKRARVARPESERASESERDGRDTRVVKRRSTPKPADGGFLAGLLSSVAEHAGGIASGKEHEVRQGLRGGEVSGVVDKHGYTDMFRQMLNTNIFCLPTQFTWHSTVWVVELPTFEVCSYGDS